jgi:hypothetical protein
VFLSYLLWLRGLAGFAAEDAVLLMDTCSAHVNEDVIHLLTETRVCVITFAPHTTKFFEVVDLALFGFLERRQRYELRFQNDNAIVKFILKVHHDFKSTMEPPKVWGDFDALGLDFDTRREPCRLLFEEEKLRGSSGFRELWFVDFPLDQLSGQRCAARFDWINRPE